MRELPLIPPSSPFSVEQRAWLNGYFAGLFGGTAPVMQVGASEMTAAPAATTLTVLYGSQSGNCETLARALGKRAKAAGLDVQVKDLDGFPLVSLQLVSNVLILCSTFGDGEMPDSAKTFWEALADDSAPRLEQLHFGVLALGDTNYGDSFCQAGRELDHRLAELGAVRLVDRVDCDVDFDAPADAWIASALEAVKALAPAAPASQSAAAPSPSPAAAAPMPAPETLLPLPPITSERKTVTGPVFSIKNPFPARLIDNRPLNGVESAKDTRHIAIDLASSGDDLAYEAGDALGVLCRNSPDLVDATLKALGCSGKESVPNRDGRPVPLRVALTEDYDITSIPKPLLQTMAGIGGKADPAGMLNGKAVDGIDSYIHGRHVVDLLEDFPACRPDLHTLVGSLRKLQPRYYSIASSPLANPGEVHLTIGVVRYDTHGRKRLGVCSGWLSHNLPLGATVKVFLSRNKNFRLPADLSTPVIMIGPGTGVAPFRAFLQERRATGASGGNWLLFGDQRESQDFLYREELAQLQAEGVLSRLDTAFSRDQDTKVYVQHRMLQHAQELYAWLENGAHLYVCGDASRMAKDVDAALHQVVAEQRGVSAEEAAAYVKELKAQKRYQRDVY